jgi:hypothetical protein
MELCYHYLPIGTICHLDEEGKILCPFCGLPIHSQMEMEK